jgi:hypothetical protein
MLPGKLPSGFRRLRGLKNEKALPSRRKAGISLRSTAQRVKNKRDKKLKAKKWKPLLADTI